MRGLSAERQRERQRERQAQSFAGTNTMNYLEDTSPCPLSEEESRLAYGAKQRALDILVDALRKQDSVLVENAGEYGHSVGRRPSLSPHLVLSLRAELERVTFVKVAHPFYAICYIYPRSHERIIYLGPRFWKQGQFLGADSRPGLLIKKAAQFLLHQIPGAVPAEHGTVVQGQRHEALSANQIRREFERVLKHRGIYTGHFYLCCGETARDSVCEDSFYSSRPWLLSEEEWGMAEEAKQRTLRILFDALEKKDCLLVENPEDFVGVQRLRNCPLIPICLVQDLISNLVSVRFRRGHGVNIVLEYLGNIIIYLSPQFWQQKEMLECGSRPGTLILELSEFLGYKRCWKGPEEADEVVQEQPHNFPLTAYSICWVFETWMSHAGSYSGTYSCCGEKARDSVCALSHLSVCLNDITPPPLTP
ncbi:hypothetical protein XENTR_v10024829 [Xenopus tropicalis]|uniref:Uncharacterized protein LOC101730798 n=1 Tax=Xenopus tropicalis TaxID=8364 RepID=A0A8J0R710_XENTR|nr:uncharacterized protein LOC101730798 [Xenopus tropicalis]KAE8581558.1 hypothetical protein XENTR_v10024829 [Xenopus tropicalis]